MSRNARPTGFFCQNDTGTHYSCLHPVFFHLCLHWLLNDGTKSFRRWVIGNCRGGDVEAETCFWVGPQCHAIPNKTCRSEPSASQASHKSSTQLGPGQVGQCALYGNRIYCISNIILLTLSHLCFVAAFKSNIMTESAEAVAANLSSRRSVTIEITNLTNNYCLINPK